MTKKKKKLTEMESWNVVGRLRTLESDNYELYKRYGQMIRNMNTAAEDHGELYMRVLKLERPNFLIRAYRWIIEPMKPGYWE